ncbi:MAG: putative lipoprotein YerB [Actinobacteria bacterium]|nr:putative lipoprotein YerB [Actinomycetota bacterium]
MVRKGKVIVTGFGVILLLALFLVLLLVSSCKKAETPASPTEEETTAVSPVTTEEISQEQEEVPGGPYSPYDGKEVDQDISNLRPLAIIVENLPVARPQSGLTKASVVYEIVSEGGITRYVVIYGPNINPEIIGPVRSARPYYVEIAHSFDALFASFGGSEQAVKVIDYLEIPDIDAIRTGAPHWRDQSRSAPNNAYMNANKLRAFAENKGYSLSGGRSPFLFKEDAPEEGSGEPDTIVVNFSQPSFQAKFVYNLEGNDYLKYVAGNPHVDRETGEQIRVKNVIVQITDIVNVGGEPGHVAVRTTGEGQAFYFLDGKGISGTWRREGVDDPFAYLDQDGAPVKFNRGQIWVCFVPSEENLAATSLGD